jgi:thiol:disulfide interchange protein/signal transduction histidine kinase
MTARPAIGMARVGLRTRFLLVVLFAAVLPLALIGAWLVHSSARAGEALLRSQLGDALAAEAARITTRWREVNGDLLLLADNDVAWRMLARPGNAAPPFLAEAFAVAHPGIAAIAYENLAGVVQLALPVDSAVRGPVTSGAADPGTGGRAQRRALPVAAGIARQNADASALELQLPVRDSAGTMVGTMHARLHPAALLEGQQQVGGADALFALLDGRTGAVLASTLMPAEALVAERFQWDERDWLSVGHALEEPPLELRLAAPLTPVIEPFGRAARTGGIALLLVSLLVIAVTTYLTRRITRSVLDATSAAEAIAGGDLEQRVRVDGTDEVGRLARALNTMAASLRDTLDALSRQRTHAALGEFATSLAHEVRNAHTTIGVDLQRLLDQAGDRPAEKALLGRALRRVRSIDRIVNGALRVARSGHIEARVVDLCRVLVDASRAAQPWFAERGARLHSQRNAGECIPIIGDAAALEALFVNLLRNAAQALPPGGTAQIAVSRTGTDVDVVITDDGEGMTPAEVVAALQPFVTSREDGTGLGLPIARQIAYAHGGDLELTSTAGAGTRVRVRLPAGAAGELDGGNGSRRTTGAASRTALLHGCTALVVALSAAAAPAAAQQERPARWSLAARADVVQSGGATELVLSAAVDEGWYLYALSQPAGGPQPLLVEVAGAGFRLAGGIGAPRPRTYADRTFDLFTAIHRGNVIFTLPVAVEGANGRREVAALVTYQMCNSTYCLPPRTDTVSTVVTVAGDSAWTAGPPAVRAASSAAAPPDSALVTASDPGSASAFTPATAYSDAAAVSSLPTIPAPHAGPAAPLAFGQAAAAVGPSGAAAVAGFLWLAILMGVLSLLTPCVFPMVPITVAYFGARGSAAAGVRVRSAALYGAGIIGTFTAAGVFTAVVFGAGGVILLAANPWMNLAIAALFVLFALNLMGRLELRLPTSLISRAAHAGGADGGAFLMGGAFAVTSFTCTAPFVGTLLVLATQGSWRWPLLGLAAYATAFALPFVLLALAPGALARLPQPGAWMRDVRAVVGILELAAAAKFISNADLVWGWNVLTRDVVIIAWLAALAAIVLLLLARRRAAWPRVAAAACTSLAAVVLARGLDGHRLGELEAFLPPAEYGALSAGADELPWRLNDLEGGLAAAAAEGRPLLLDFTGYTCINCRWMEAKMFPRREVRTLLDGYVRVRLYTDGKGAVYQQQQALQARMFGTVALPYYAILTPAGTPVSTFLGMTRRERDFISFLRTGLDTR